MGGIKRAGLVLIIITIFLFGVQIIASKPSKTAIIPCGATITANTTLDSDIGPCSGDGLIINTNDVTLDCAGHQIVGLSLNNQSGITLSKVASVTVKNCKVYNFSRETLAVALSSDNVIEDTILSSSYGNTINLYYSTGNLFTHVNISGGHEISFLQANNNVFSYGEVSNMIYPVLLVACEVCINNTFLNMTFSNNSQPLEIGFDSNKIIRSKIINSPGIDINTQNVLIEENIIMNNFGGGDSGQLAALRVRGGSGHNITKNQIINNLVGGIELITTSGNSITSNTISNNAFGINITDTTSNNNLIYNNYFSNPINAQDNSINSWNTTKILGTNIIGGPFIGGNFWSDYFGIDTNGDRLGDQNRPYNSNGNILNGGDYLPLVAPTYNISSCQNITSSGNYVVTQNLSTSGSCIIVDANDVRLICNGYSIIGSDIIGTYGVAANSRNNIGVKNCHIIDFAVGMYFINITNSTIQNNTLISNRPSGLIAGASQSNIIERNYVTGSDSGILLTGGSSYHTLKDNTLVSNTNEGIFVQGPYNIIKNNTARFNHKGIEISFTSNNIVEENIFSSNNYGIWLAAENNTFRKNIINSNIIAGLATSNPGFAPVNNLIYNNWFNNTVNAQDSYTNSWNTTKIRGINIIGGPFIGGNFWSDYLGNDTDGDRLGDQNIPYNSSGNILNGGDYLPLSMTSGKDIIPPSQPTGLIATAVSSSQIDLQWMPSTDNVGVAGYRIYRDNISIDTTISTSYSNTGRISSTTYTYQVQAYDPSFNNSTLSESASATTLPNTGMVIGTGSSPIFKKQKLSSA